MLGILACPSCAFYYRRRPSLRLLRSCSFTSTFLTPKQEYTSTICLDTTPKKPDKPIHNESVVSSRPNFLEIAAQSSSNVTRCRAAAYRSVESIVQAVFDRLLGQTQYRDI